MAEKRKYRWDELIREHWWEPYTWERRGVGWNVIYRKDTAKDYKMYSRKLKSLKIYGLEREEHFLPMKACFGFSKFYLVIDRALHNPGDLRLFDMKTHKEIEKVTVWPYVKISREEKDYNPNPFGGEGFVFDENVKQLEKIIEKHASNTVSKFIVRGNNTIAVGLLPNEVIVMFKEKYYLRMGCVRLDRKEIKRTLGTKTSSKLSQLYVLAIEGGKIK